MTESPPPPAITRKRQAQAYLRALHRWMSSVSDAADAVVTNFLYQEDFGIDRRTGYLLDFDFIGSGLRVIAAHRLAMAAASTSRKDPLDPVGETLWNFERMAGPYTVRAALADLDNVIIPPGAEYELRAWQEKVDGVIADQARVALDHIKRAMESPSPLTYLAEQRGGVALKDGIRKQIKDIHAARDDLEFLSSIVARSISVDGLVTPAERSDRSRAYQTAYHTLMGSRPEYENNNYVDAINVGALAEIFHSSKQNGLLPILISSTRAIEELHGHQRVLKLPGSDRRKFFSNPFYLHLVRALSWFGGRDSRLVPTKAQVLVGHCHPILDAVVKLMFQIDRQTEQEVDMDSPSWRLLRLDLEQFDEAWNDVSAAVLRKMQLDRVACENVIISSHLTVDRWLATLPDAGRGTIEGDVRMRLQGALEELASWDRSFRRALAGEGPLELAGEQPDDDRHRAIEQLFTFSMVVINDDNPASGPLAEMAPGAPLAAVVEVERPARLLVHSRYFAWSGAVLTFEIRPERDELCITWPHAVNLEVLLRRWVDLSRQLKACGVVGDGPVTLELFVGAECLNAVVPAGNIVAMVTELSTKQAAEMKRVDFIQAELDGVMWDLDVDAFLGEEHQIRMTVGRAQLTGEWSLALAEFMASTAAVQARGGTGIYQQLLTRIIEALPRRRTV